MNAKSLSWGFTRRAASAVLITAAIVLAWASPARAQVTLRGAGEGGLLVDPARDQLGGGGIVSAWLGYSPELWPIIVVPEIGGGFAGFGDPSGRLFGRAVMGVRGGVAASVEPSLSLHGGYSYRAGDDPLRPLAHHAFTYDAIVGLDFRVSRALSLGPQLSYLGFVFPGDSTVDHVIAAGLGITGWL